MCERFVITHMPPEEEQLNEVLQLRSQGMTYKQIAGDSPAAYGWQKSRGRGIVRLGQEYPDPEA